jgi:hypothetical protein
VIEPCVLKGMGSTFLAKIMLRINLVLHSKIHFETKTSISLRPSKRFASHATLQKFYLLDR